MMGKWLVACAAAALLSACASSAPAWHKAGVTQHDAESALAQCQYQVGMSRVPEKQQQALVEECMRGQGYRWGAR